MNPLTLPLARLRSQGCRVSAIIGHDPAIGEWIYGVTPPANSASMATLAAGLSDTDVRRDGVTVTPARYGRRLIVSVSANQRVTADADASLRRAAAHRLADTLTALADRLTPKG